MWSSAPLSHWELNRRTDPKHGELAIVTVHYGGDVANTGDLEMRYSQSLKLLDVTLPGKFWAKDIPLSTESRMPNPAHVHVDRPSGILRLFFEVKNPKSSSSADVSGDKAAAADAVYTQANAAISKKDWDKATRLIHAAEYLDPNNILYPGVLNMISDLKIQDGNGQKQKRQQEEQQQQQQQQPSSKSQPNNPSNKNQQASGNSSYNKSSAFSQSNTSTTEHDKDGEDDFPFEAFTTTGTNNHSIKSTALGTVSTLLRFIASLSSSSTDISFSELKNQPLLRVMSILTTIIAMIALKLWLTGGGIQGIIIGVGLIALSSPIGFYKDYFLGAELGSLAALAPIRIVRYIYITNCSTDVNSAISNGSTIISRLIPAWIRFGWRHLALEPTIYSCYVWVCLTVIAVVYLKGLYFLAKKKLKKKGLTDDGDKRSPKPRQLMPLHVANLVVRFSMSLPLFTWMLGRWWIALINNLVLLWFKWNLMIPFVPNPVPPNTFRGYFNTTCYAVGPLILFTIEALVVKLIWPVLAWTVRAFFWSHPWYTAWPLTAFFLTERPLKMFRIQKLPFFHNKFVLTMPFWCWLLRGGWSTIAVAIGALGPDIVVMLIAIYKVSLWTELDRKYQRGCYVYPFFALICGGYWARGVCSMWAALPQSIIYSAIVVFGVEAMAAQVAKLSPADREINKNCFSVSVMKVADYISGRKDAAWFGRSTVEGWASSRQSSASRKSSSFTPMLMKPLPVPKDAPEVVSKVLLATNHYTVLGVPEDASNAVINRAKRTLSLATHPDKAANVPGAPAACQRVLEAAEVLLDTQKRSEYDQEMGRARIMANRSDDELIEEMADELFDETGVDITKLGTSIIMACDSCERGFHQIPLAPEKDNPSAARYCSECKRLHPVSEGESWIEARTFMTSIFGKEIRMYTCHHGKIYNSSEIGECLGYLQLWARERIPVNTHKNLLAKATTSAGNSSKSKNSKNKNKGGGSGSGQQQQQQQGGGGGKKNKKKGRRN